jgi:hypothetical protein
VVYANKTARISTLKVSALWGSLRFDYDAGRREWFVVATFVTCESWYDLGRPELPYVEYRANGEQWKVVPLSVELIGRSRNIQMGIKSAGELSLLTFDGKREMRDKNSVEGERYRKIVGVWRTTG